MKHLGFYLLLLATFLTSPARTAPLDSFVFSSAYGAYLGNDLQLPPAVRAGAAQTRFILVAGFLNEGMPCYFQENVQALRDGGVPASQIHILFPESGRGIEDNVAPLARQILQLTDHDDKRLVLIGHSKGAVELLAAAVLTPELARRASTILLIQGAFGGSGIADFIQDVGRPMSPQIPWQHAVWLWTSKAAGSVLNQAINPGFSSLRRDYARAYWTNLLTRHARDIREVSPKVYYIRSYVHPDHAAPILNCTGWYLHTAYGPNDGLVEYDDQYVVGIGRDLATLEADHAGLTSGMPISHVSERVRRALMWTILHTVVETP